MKFQPAAGAFGALVHGVDLSTPPEEGLVKELRGALLEHRLLIFRDQKLDPASLRALGARFGSLDVHPFIDPVPGFPEVIAVVKEPHEKANFGGGWHAEVSFYECPAMGTLLYAKQTPRRGGDTLLADMVAAYEAFSPGMKQLLDGVEAVHSAEHVYGPGGAYEGRAGDPGAGTGVKIREEARKRVVHPVVRTHPETEQKLLYVNRAFCVGIAGMWPHEARPLLDLLVEHAERPEFVTRLHWEPGTLAFWDNRSTQHYALNDYTGERREMLRVVVEGDRPV